MLCAAIDIGSNTTRVLVAEPDDGPAAEGDGAARLHPDRQATRSDDGAISAREGRRGRRGGRDPGAPRRGARGRGDPHRRHGRDPRGDQLRRGRRRDRPRGRAWRSTCSARRRRGRLAFIGATKTLGHPVDGQIAVVDVGGGSSEIVFGTVAGGVEAVRSFKVGSGSLAEDHISNDPPSASEIRALRDAITDFFEGVEVDQPEQAVAVGGSATSLRKLVGAVLEYETLERGVRVLSGDPIADVARRFELDPRRVEMLPAGVLLLEKLSELLGQPLQIGKGGLREGVILTLLNGAANGAPTALAA